MIQMYSERDKARAFAAKKRLWMIFTAAAALWAGVCAPCYVFRYSIGYGWAMFINIAATAVFGCFCLFFFSLKFRLTSSFIRMLKGFDNGLKEEREGDFVEFDMTPVMKDGVNCYTLVTAENYNKRNKEAERRIMMEITRVPPPFKPGDRLHYFTHANFLVEYEVFPLFPNYVDGE